MAERINMPTSGGGLVRYFDDYKSKLEIAPIMVVIAIIVIIVVELYLHAFQFLG